MTLLVAPSDIATRRPAINWNCVREESRRRSHKLAHRRQQSFRIVAGNLVWLWTLLAALVAITLPALLNNKSSLFFGASVDQEKPTNETSLEVVFASPYTIAAPRAFELEENSLGLTSLSAQESILGGANSLLGDKNVALLDALESASLKLENAVPFNLANTNLAEKGNRKSASQLSRLARVTVYWPEEGDFYTRNRKSSTGYSPPRRPLCG